MPKNKVHNTSANHTKKIRLARKLLSNVEIKTHEHIFDSKNWDTRNLAISNRVNKKNELRRNK